MNSIWDYIQPLSARKPLAPHPAPPLAAMKSLTA
jgi:hypothetical protein